MPLSSSTIPEPRRPEVTNRARVIPMFFASTPRMSWAPTPSRARGNGWNSLIGKSQIWLSSMAMTLLDGFVGWRTSTTLVVANYWQQLRMGT
ncbi:hypothetical protein WY02_13560 [Pseudonocardia sp. AL041005-10]|nr:hypothetical protein WY02_13560 [Pseudonocardia sp. AL041005-10]